MIEQNIGELLENKVVLEVKVRGQISRSNIISSATAFISMIPTPMSVCVLTSRIALLTLPKKWRGEVRISYFFAADKDGPAWEIISCAWFRVCLVIVWPPSIRAISRTRALSSRVSMRVSVVLPSVDF